MNNLTQILGPVKTGQKKSCSLSTGAFKNLQLKNDFSGITALIPNSALVKEGLFQRADVGIQFVVSLRPFSHLQF